VRKAAEEWETQAGGGIMSRGVGGGVTGNGYDLIILDDVIKSRIEADSLAYRERVWAWYRDDVYTRLEPGGTIIIPTTRWHEDDLIGRILNSEDANQWTVINLPALAEEDDPLGRAVGEALCPDRFPREVLIDRQRVLGTYGFNALYQGHPTPPEGGLIKRSWWRFWYPAGSAPPSAVVTRLDDGSLFECPQIPLPSNINAHLQSWDMAFQGTSDSDYVVGQVWGCREADRFLLDQTRGRMDFPKTLVAVRALSARWPTTYTVLIENKANGAAVISTLRHEIGGINSVNPEGGKATRVNAVSAGIEAGNVYVPHPVYFPWVSEFIEECAGFPNAANDDQVDAMSQALTRLLRRGDWTRSLDEVGDGVGVGPLGHDEELEKNFKDILSDLGIKFAGENDIEGGW
jgi:predicted phage terminase large subunit-like protein